MYEYLSEAVVLDKEASGDLDSRISLFTKKFGKLVAKAKSARKITSKLSSHLEPGNVVQTRLIEKNGLQVIDALKLSRLTVSLVNLHSLNQLLAEAEPEARLWHSLVSQNFEWTRVLGILGWDPREAACGHCGTPQPSFFNIHRQEFFCAEYASKFSKSAVLCISSE